MSLTASFINARNLSGMGFSDLAQLANKLPAIKFTYGDYEQLDGFLNNFTELTLTGDLDPATLLTIARASITPQVEPIKVAETTQSDEQEPELKEPEATPVTEHHKNKKLTIAMATYDDFDGVYFSVQSLRMFHPEICDDIEIIILDNNPTGKCAEHLSKLAKQAPYIRYIPVSHRSGTAVRDLVFEEANSNFVLCMDCHVMIVPGAIEKLIAYYEANPDSKDLIQGPLVYDSLESISTHFEPQWQGGMYGTWRCDDRGKEIDGEPFDIPMQGLGIFSCKKSSWLGFNKDFRGFGGEEGYIHEKFRQAGGRTLCIPFLRWLHRFARPMGVPYTIQWEDRIMNYYIGFNELGLPTEQISEHFSELLNDQVVERCKEQFKREFGDFP